MTVGPGCAAVRAVLYHAGLAALGGAGNRHRRDAPDLSRSGSDDLLCGLWQRAFLAARLHCSGAGGFYPLDAALSLLTHCYSVLLREWAVYGAADVSSRESQTILECFLRLSLIV
jgi:hypothetical protein